MLPPEGIISNTNWDDTQGFSLFCTSYTELVFDVGNNPGKKVRIPYQTDQWFHFCVTWNPSPIEVKAYVNGTEVGAMESSISRSIVDSSVGYKILIGDLYHQDAPMNNGDFMIDEFGLWYKTLSAANVSALFNSY